MEKTVDNYMGLPYAVELDFDGEGYRASIRELPECTATVGGSDSLEELWWLLKDAQRKWTKKQLKMGREVPEPPGATVDPFWRDFPDELDQHDVREMLYEHGAQYFPLRILERLWLEELREVRLGEADPAGGGPSKAALPHHDRRTPDTEGDSRLAYLGEAEKRVWLEFDGPRTDFDEPWTNVGYKAILVVDKPPRAEAATIAALTILEASRIEDADFERLREALLEHAERHPEELRGKGLEAVLDELPARWFVDLKAALDDEIGALPAEELGEHLPKSWERWERSSGLWERSVRFMVALLRCRRPGFDGYALEEQLAIVGAFRRRLNKFLEAQRSYVNFLEYRTARDIRKTVKRAQDQVTAAMLCDVSGYSHRDIAKKMGIAMPERYKGNMKIPEVGALVRDGRELLDKVLETGWKERAKEMRAEGERYKSLSWEEKEIERLARRLMTCRGWTGGRQALCSEKPRGSRRMP